MSLPIDQSSSLISLDGSAQRPSRYTLNQSPEPSPWMIRFNAGRELETSSVLGATVYTLVFAADSIELWLQWKSLRKIAEED
ncbi:uncharacterized protein ACLA_055040 [Aspergillus clavatus NRRL 1]|uniref:Uncharacterized protein n=1 Tax=Aspergillus clavatus (strain ATCC 1007 / CBS 513.65 / DSM 816 / NCTC 3887 / NRRL 1 / QM 1276 / 107) TaxID=344612 RepID=A1C9D3_ASPCL|nr:uncharacterized protein ACLA_055040 [Aspergillus clavatus NRRL 1]EAW13457.1 hypothetical protein ACLA_055040 [Aspergillus clavatus NRRL 1]